MVTPVAHTTQVPALPDADNGAAITVGARFTVAASFGCAGVAFWVPATNTGTYTVGLWRTTADDSPAGSGTGTLLASATVAAASVTAGGWVQCLFAGAVTLSPGVVYTAARHATSGRYVATTGVFAAGPVSGGGVTLLQDGTNPQPPDLGVMRNGVFDQGVALAYPASQFGTPDYFVDIVGGGVVAKVKTVTLTAATVSTQTFTGFNASMAEVTSLDGAAEVYFTVDGSTPTVGGENCHVLPAAISSLEVKEEISGDAVVKLISSGTPKISVRVW